MKECYAIFIINTGLQLTSEWTCFTCGGDKTNDSITPCTTSILPKLLRHREAALLQFRDIFRPYLKTFANGMQYCGAVRIASFPLVVVGIQVYTGHRNSTRGSSSVGLQNHNVLWYHCAQRQRGNETRRIVREVVLLDGCMKGFTSVVAPVITCTYRRMSCTIRTLTCLQ